MSRRFRICMAKGGRESTRLSYGRSKLTLISIKKITVCALVAGAWTEREKMFHGGSFLKLADDNMDIQNPKAQNRELSGF